MRESCLPDSKLQQGVLMHASGKERHSAGICILLKSVERYLVVVLKYMLHPLKEAGWNPISLVEEIPTIRIV